MPKTAHHGNMYMERLLGQEEVDRRFAESYARLGRADDAAGEVFGNSIARLKNKGNRMLKRPTVQALLRQTLQAKNATPVKAAEIIADATDATKWVDTDAGKVEVKDHTVRLKAADMINKAWGVYDKMREEGDGGKHLHIYMQEPIAVQKFILKNGRMPTDAERAELAEKPINA